MFIHLATAAVLLLQTAGAAKPASPQGARATPPVAKPAVKAVSAAKPAATDVAVTLAYKGKGTVDAQHQLIAWLFTDGDITSNSRPVATASAAKNGETVTFSSPPAGPLYVFAVYDEKGGYDGRSGPPPAGVPTGLYRKTPKGAPAVVKPGELVVLTFADLDRWNK